MSRLAPLLMILALAATALGGCAWMASSGPRRSQVEKPQENSRISAMRLVDIDLGAVQRLHQSESHRLFSEVLGTDAPASEPANIMGPGDVLVVSIWEAPPAALFSPAALVSVNGATGSNSALVTTLPPQVVEADGSIEVPFAGSVAVSGKSPQQ